ncbi:MAG: M15 family metallopeptidase [Magnetococcales bacterium]|nr:M15 family metallopeptidase [Magnetococcales bacterium]
MNAIWEKEHIKKITPPAGWQLYYQMDDELVKVSGIRMHRFLEGSFQSVLRDVWQHALNEVGRQSNDETVRAWLHERRLDIHGGGYNFRPKRGGVELSLHSFGIAIDWDPIHNPRKNPLTCTLPQWWFDIWKEHGWHNGRKFHTPDPMHVQFATGV